VREDGDLRSLMQTLGSATLGIGLGLAVLGGGFLISRMTLADSTVVASGAPATATVPSTARATATASARATVPASATPVPVPTPDPMVVTAYQGQGLRLAALTIPANYTVTSPIAGKVTVALYQYVDGEIRSGTNIADLPSYPYVFIRSADREVKLRPGALDKDVKLLVKDGDTIAAGGGLFTTLTTGASSWQTFYDRNVTAQVIASVTAQPSGNEVDPVPVFKK
jgi:biotin carboxyl carrier protein